MDSVLAALDERERVMAWIDVHKVGRERIGVVIRGAEAEHILIERQQLLHRSFAINVERRVTDAERAGAESGDRSAGLEWLARYFGAMKELNTVTVRIVADD